MIRLVTQFDVPTARPAAATPTCGSSSCSCCSCCIGTAVASMAFTAISVHHRGQDSDVHPARRRGATLLGFLALPTGIGAGVAVWESTGSGGAALVLTTAVWLACAAAAYRLARTGRWFGRALGVVVVGAVAGFIEFAVGAGAGGSVGYVIFGLLAGLVAIGLGVMVASEY